MSGMNNDQPRGRGAQQGDGFTDIPCPARWDAVGHALRRSYAAPPETCALPAEMTRLLDMLDQRAPR